MPKTWKYFDQLKMVDLYFSTILSLYKRERGGRSWTEPIYLFEEVQITKSTIKTSPDFDANQMCSFFLNCMH